MGSEGFDGLGSLGDDDLGDVEGCGLVARLRGKVLGGAQG